LGHSVLTVVRTEVATSGTSPGICSALVSKSNIFHGHVIRSHGFRGKPRQWTKGFYMCDTHGSGRWQCRTSQMWQCVVQDPTIPYLMPIPSVYPVPTKQNNCYHQTQVVGRANLPQQAKWLHVTSPAVAANLRENMGCRQSAPLVPYLKYSCKL